MSAVSQASSMSSSHPTPESKKTHVQFEENACSCQEIALAVLCLACFATAGGVIYALHAHTFHIAAKIALGGTAGLAIIVGLVSFATLQRHSSC